MLQVNESDEISALRARESELRKTLHACSSNEYLARLITAIHAHREEGRSRLEVFDRVVAGDHFMTDEGFFFDDDNNKVVQRLGGISFQERLECVPHLQRLGFGVETYGRDRWTVDQGYCAMTIDWSGDGSMPVRLEHGNAECGITYHPASSDALPVRKTRRPFGPRDSAARALRFAVNDRVLALTENGWMPGTITFTWWRHPQAPPARWARYEITLDAPIYPDDDVPAVSSRLIYCYGEDTDDVIRALDS